MTHEFAAFPAFLKPAAHCLCAWGRQVDYLSQ
jgi:hypothetical protein